MSMLSRNVAWGLMASAVATGVALVAAQPPAPATIPPAATEPAPTPDPVKAVDPLGAMLSNAKTAHGKLRDYTCVFTRQERANGVLGAEQSAEMKVRTKPLSLAVRFARPEAVAGLEQRYSADSRSGKMKYRPAGAKGANGFQLLAVDDPKVLADTRHPLTELGIGATIDRLAGIATREKTLGNALEVFETDFQFGGKNVSRYEILARRSHAHRYAYRMLVYVEKDTKLPVRFEAYDAPKAGTTAGELLESYSYTDLKLNPGLGDSAFE